MKERSPSTAAAKGSLIYFKWHETTSQTVLPLQKHACWNKLKNSPPKTENFQKTNSDIFHISAQNIDCGYSLEPPHLTEAVLTSTNNLCVWAEMRKIMFTPVNPSFTV